MRQPGEAGDADFLTVQIGGDGGREERMMLIARPVGGIVRVREWRSGGWNAEPAERDVAVGDLFDEIQRAARERRSISQELYLIRTWLDGTAP